jgi:hypothetical protein
VCAVGTVSVVDVVRPAASLAPVLDAVAAAARAAGRDPAGVCVSKGTHRGGEEVLYTRAEVVAGVSDYIRLNALTDPADPTRVVLDPTLTDALYRNAKKTAAGYPTGVSKQEASAQALSQCAPWHIVRCGDTSVGHPGVVVPIEIVVKALQGGKKHMTFVRNCQACARARAVARLWVVRGGAVALLPSVQLFGIDATEFAKDSSKLYACSASTQPSETHPDMEVCAGCCSARPPVLLWSAPLCLCARSRTSSQDAQIQGDVGDDVAERLAEVYKVPKKYINLKKSKR